ncbi:hypothetical protein PV326_014298, partial [Microctonus aethiopoides]
EMIETLLSLGNIEEFAEGMFMLLTLISCCGKVLTLLVYRKRIILLFETFKCPVCQTSNPQEAANSNRWIYMRNVDNNDVNDTPLLRNKYSSSNNTIENLAAFQCGHRKSIIDIAYATLVPTFMSSICEQFGLLECRIQLFIMSIENSKNSQKDRIEFEKKRFADFIQHHLLLFQFASDANDIFGPALLIQYISSITVICMCIYQLGQLTSVNIQLVSTLLYTCRIFFEIFLLCLAGTELTEAMKAMLDMSYLDNNGSSNYKRS